ncbi:MAG: DUF1573 domain-containing protein [Planctomycetia bacterium]|nr:DUF1573 domain-containing protein [Planctomycetia bacterium]
MKTWLLAVVCLVLGIVCGISAAAWRAGVPTSSDPLEAMAAVRQAHQSATERPRFGVDAESFDFGRVSGLDQPQHSFQVTNTGTLPLRVQLNTAEMATCKCQVNSVPNDPIEPGATAEVTIGLRSPGQPGRFRHVVPLLTNDPDRPRVELALTGDYVLPLQVQPEMLALARIVPDASQAYQVMVFSDDPTVEVTKIELLDEETAKFFDVTSAPCPPQKLDPRMRSGVVLDVKIKPGIPSGPFRQTLRVTTTAGGGKPVEIPVAGEAVGDIVVSSRYWINAYEAVTLGRVQQEKGAEADLDLIVRGERHNRVKVRYLRSEPSYLKVELGEPIENAAKTAVRWPGKLSIAPGSPLEAYLGTEGSKAAEIILETDHPDFKEIRVKVTFYIAK